MKYILGIKCFTTDEVSQIIGMGVYSVRKNIKKGKLLATKIGNNYFISEDNLINYIQHKQQKAVSA
jgi:excisionase family DNA binding protein